MTSVLLIVAGAVYVAAIIAITRAATRVVSRRVPWVPEHLVYALTLASTAHNYLRWAQAGGNATAVQFETAGLAAFGLLALAGLRWPMALAAGWLAHVAWDYALHPMPATVWVPWWFPDLCVGFDIPLAAYIAARARGHLPLRAARRLAAAGAAVLAVVLLAAGSASAQEAATAGTQSQPPAHDHAAHGADAHAHHDAAAPDAPRPFHAAILHHAGSGTSIEPPASPVPMLMGRRGAWMWMVHGNVVLAAVEQNSPASRDKVLSNNWLMPMVGRRLGPGLLTARTMVSLEPATSRFTTQPEPFQAAHDLVMELAATYDLPVSRDVLLSFYTAPVGEPALGPSAFMHRLSSADNPLRPLGHGMQDVTHQARDVLTAGVAYRNVRVEVSGFHGRMPDGNRVAIEQGAIDSWSARVSASPGPRWVLQASTGRIESPGAARPGVDVQRTTASVAYTTPLGGRGFWASTAIWGRDEPTGAGLTRDSVLVESTLQTPRGHILFGRAESAGQEVMIGGPGGHRHVVRPVRSATIGYARQVAARRRLETAVGVELTLFATPDEIAPVYGSRPAAVTCFIRVRPNGR